MGCVVLPWVKHEQGEGRGSTLTVGERGWKGGKRYMRTKMGHNSSRSSRSAQGGHDSRERTTRARGLVENPPKLDFSFFLFFPSFSFFDFPLF